MRAAARAMWRDAARAPWRGAARALSGAVAVACPLGALVLALALASPATAGEAEPTGSATLTIAADKARLLAKRGIAIAGVRGADTEGRQTRFQIDRGAIGADTAAFSLNGALRLAVVAGRGGGGASASGKPGGAGENRRTVRLSALRIELGRDSTLTGRLDRIAAVDGRRAGRGAHRSGRRVLFDLEAPADNLAIDTTKGLARLQGARLVWRQGAARALGRRLGVAVPGGLLGKIRVGAATLSLANDALTPKSGPLGDEPPLLARPASAIDVTGGSLTWQVRDSWIRYVNTEAAPEALEGASAEPPIEESSHPCPDRPAGANPTLVYSYSFPFSNGWYDPPSGTAALYYYGGVRFTYPSRGIDLATRNPEIEIDGGASRAIFRLRGAGETPYPDRRAPLLDVATSGPPSETSPSSFGFPGPLRGKLTGDGQNVFAGFYPAPNDGFGCVSVTFTTGS